MAYARTPHELNKFFEEGKPGDVIEAPYSVLKTWITDYPKPTIERAETTEDACLSKRVADPAYLCNRLKGHTGVHAWIDYTGTAKTIWPQVWSPELKTEPVEPTPREQVLRGIYNPGPEGRCKKMANLEGTSIQCNLSAQHEGWAHQSREHHLIWES